ncbi:hypothetical protein BN1723_010967 [Verticillium longisporum]|uniref:Uncharacterized protein n=1 Tax=Verticillium longisporum TaxID=100787 RepID=A0A0G4L311_VERLO|nr:hypothetical protein BN1723_010967 [Verticillium longisporum]
MVTKPRLAMGFTRLSRNKSSSTWCRASLLLDSASALALGPGRPEPLRQGHSAARAVCPSASQGSRLSVAQKIRTLWHSQLSSGRSPPADSFTAHKQRCKAEATCVRRTACVMWRVPPMREVPDVLDHESHTWSRTCSSAISDESRHSPPCAPPYAPAIGAETHPPLSAPCVLIQESNVASCTGAEAGRASCLDPTVSPSIIKRLSLECTTCARRQGNKGLPARTCIQASDAFKPDLPSRVGEQAATALEANLAKLESRLDELLAGFETDELRNASSGGKGPAEK